LQPSIWNMHHNNDGVFPHGDTFDPSRFYQSDANDVTKDPSLVDGHWSFGFGRRACPARYLAANSVWIALARMIWAFDVTRAPGAERMSFNIDDVKWIVGVNMYVCVACLPSITR
jgi:cytochrome P450